MRLLNLTHQYLPDKIGGVERYTQSISRALAERGHQVSVFYRRSAAGVGLERREEGGVAVWAAWAGSPSPTRRFLATFGDAPLVRAFAHVLDETRPELVHVQHLMGLPARLLTMLRQRGIPTVVTLHDYWWICANAQLLTNYDQRVCAGPRFAWLNCGRCALARGGADVLWPLAAGLTPLLAARERILRAGLRDAAQIIAPAPFVKRWYAAHGLDAARMIVLPHGIERPEALDTHQNHPPAAPDETAAAFRIAYIGGLAWQKGVHVLIEAFNRLPPGAELWIAGDESADPAYVQQLRTLAGPGVRFLGALTRGQVWATLGQVDVVAVPALWHETFSLIVHEAFAAGRPVIASRLGALADRIQDGVDGLLVMPGDVAAWSTALRGLLDNPTACERLRAGIRPPLTLAEHVARLEEIYSNFLHARHM